MKTYRPPNALAYCVSCRRFAVALIAVAACATASALAADKPAGPAPYKVGMLTRPYVDEHRKSWSGAGPRPMRTAVWYPAQDNARETEAIGAPMFDGGSVAPAADVSTHEKTYPLILLSHGTGGSAIQLMWLGRYLAARGFIVAAPNHHGNTGVEQYQAQGFMLFWERPKDLSAALDLLLADPQIGPFVDRDRIGAAGFSLGGYTVLAIAGGQFSPERFDEFCASAARDFTCRPQAEFPDARRQFEALKNSNLVVQESLARAHDSYQDARIRAVFAIAPVFGGGFARRGLQAIRIPVEIVVGDADSVASAATNAEYFAANIKGARLTVLPGGVGHYTFLSDCTAEGRGGLPICRDATGVDRAGAHRQVSQMAVEFFERTLKASHPAT
jgi:predicted dienelactone hydrolase